MACQVVTQHDYRCFYERILYCQFVGRYLGLKQIRHYGTERAVYEVDRWNPYNEDFLKIIEEIRQAASQYHKRVRCCMVIRTGFSN